MPKGILGRKLGMTQIFREDGSRVPVTVVEAGPCHVIGRRTSERNGYTAVILAFGERRRVNKPLAGQLKGSGVERPARIREFRGDSALEPGQIVQADIFNPGEKVDVVGTSKGHGFAGGIKRHGFHRGPMTHGSKFHRAPGSLSARMSGGGGKVFKGRRLPGHYGHDRVTVQNLEIVKVMPERNVILIKGAVPGVRGSYLMIKESVKRKKARP